MHIYIYRLNKNSVIETLDKITMIIIMVEEYIEKVMYNIIAHCPVPSQSQKSDKLPGLLPQLHCFM